MENNKIENLREQIIALRTGKSSADKHRGYWSDEDKQLFTKMYDEGIGISEMAAFFCRTEDAIFNQIRSMGLRKRTRAPKADRAECKCSQCSHYKTCGRVNRQE